MTVFPITRDLGIRRRRHGLAGYLARTTAAIFPILVMMLGCSEVKADPDCDAIKSRRTPVELRFHAGQVRLVLQSYRGRSDQYVVCIRRDFAPDSVLVGEYNYSEGLPAESQETALIRGKLSTSSAQSIIEGFPHNFDRRSDLRYRQSIIRIGSDGNKRQTTRDIRYEFKSVETTVIGSCVLTAVKGESIVTNAAPGEPARRYHVYLPDLNLTLSEPAPPVIDSLSSAVVPMTGIRPCPASNS